jgi:predicted transcriptional regulator
LCDGRKMHEFRRRFPKETGPFQVIFYISSPVKAICGIALFDKPLFQSIDSLSALIRKHKYSTEESLRSYLHDLETGVALPLIKIKKINPISLDTLRRQVPGFCPPQAYMYYDAQRFKNLNSQLNLYETSNESIQRTLF